MEFCEEKDCLLQSRVKGKLIIKDSTSLEAYIPLVRLLSSVAMN